jgi:hypothetical protein
VKISIESTGDLTHLDGVPVRAWKGVTERGVPCVVFVHRVAVAATENTDQFERELKETLEPGRVVDLRHVL